MLSFSLSRDPLPYQATLIHKVSKIACHCFINQTRPKGTQSDFRGCLKQCFSTTGSRHQMSRDPLLGRSQTLTFGSPKPIFQYRGCNKCVAKLYMIQFLGHQLPNVKNHRSKWSFRGFQYYYKFSSSYSLQVFSMLE